MAQEPPPIGLDPRLAEAEAELRDISSLKPQRTYKRVLPKAQSPIPVAKLFPKASPSTPRLSASAISRAKYAAFDWNERHKRRQLRRQAIDEQVTSHVAKCFNSAPPSIIKYHSSQNDATERMAQAMGRFAVDANSLEARKAVKAQTTTAVLAVSATTSVASAAEAELPTIKENLAVKETTEAHRAQAIANDASPIRSIDSLTSSLAYHRTPPHPCTSTSSTMPTPIFSSANVSIESSTSVDSSSSKATSFHLRNPRLGDPPHLVNTSGVPYNPREGLDMMDAGNLSHPASADRGYEGPALMREEQRSRDRGFGQDRVTTDLTDLAMTSTLIMLDGVVAEKEATQKGREDLRDIGEGLRSRGEEAGMEGKRLGEIVLGGLTARDASLSGTTWGCEMTTEEEAPVSAEDIVGRDPEPAPLSEGGDEFFVDVDKFARSLPEADRPELTTDDETEKEEERGIIGQVSQPWRDACSPLPCPIRNVCQECEHAEATFYCQLCHESCCPRCTMLLHPNRRSGEPHSHIRRQQIRDLTASDPVHPPHMPAFDIPGDEVDYLISMGRYSGSSGSSSSRASSHSQDIIMNSSMALFCPSFGSSPPTLKTRDIVIFNSPPHAEYAPKGPLLAACTLPWRPLQAYGTILFPPSLPALRTSSDQSSTTDVPNPQEVCCHVLFQGYVSGDYRLLAEEQQRRDVACPPLNITIQHILSTVQKQPHTTSATQLIGKEAQRRSYELNRCIQTYRNQSALLNESNYAPSPDDFAPPLGQVAPQCLHLLLPASILLSPVALQRIYLSHRLHTFSKPLTHIYRRFLGEVYFPPFRSWRNRTIRLRHIAQTPAAIRIQAHIRRYHQRYTLERARTACQHAQWLHNRQIHAQFNYLSGPDRDMHRAQGGKLYTLNHVDYFPTLHDLHRWMQARRTTVARVAFFCHRTAITDLSQALSRWKRCQDHTPPTHVHFDPQDEYDITVPPPQALSHHPALGLPCPLPALPRLGAKRCVNGTIRVVDYRRWDDFRSSIVGPGLTTAWLIPDLLLIGNLPCPSHYPVHVEPDKDLAQYHGAEQPAHIDIPTPEPRHLSEGHSTRSTGRNHHSSHHSYPASQSSQPYPMSNAPRTPTSPHSRSAHLTHTQQALRGRPLALMEAILLAGVTTFVCLLDQAALRYLTDHYGVGDLSKYCHAQQRRCVLEGQERLKQVELELQREREKLEGMYMLRDHNRQRTTTNMKGSDRTSFSSRDPLSAQRLRVQWLEEQVSKRKAVVSKIATHVEWLHYPIAKDSTSPLANVLPLLLDLESRLRAGRRLFLWSQDGHGRAAMLGACVLGRMYSLSAQEALDRVQMVDYARGIHAEMGGGGTLRVGQGKEAGDWGGHVMYSCPSTIWQAQMVREVLGLRESEYEPLITQSGPPSDPVSMRVVRSVRRGCGLPKLEGTGRLEVEGEGDEEEEEGQG